MISFKERKISPAADTIKVRMASGSDTLSVAFLPNFPFKVSWEGDWLDMAQNTSKDSLIFMSKPNTTDTVRTCTVKVSPADNPDFVCTTFVVMQASEADKSVSFDDDDLADGFSLEQTDVDRLTLYAPAEGGDAVIWINTGREVVKESPDLEWFKSELVPGSFYNELKIHVEANDSESRRATVIETDDSGKIVKDERIKVSIGTIVAAITIIQAGKAAEE